LVEDIRVGRICRGDPSPKSRYNRFVLDPKIKVYEEKLPI